MYRSKQRGPRTLIWVHTVCHRGFSRREKQTTFIAIGALRVISDNPFIEQVVSRINPPELQLNNANSSDTEASFLYLDLSLINGRVSWMWQDTGKCQEKYHVLLNHL